MTPAYPRQFSVFLVLILCLGLAACSENSTKPPGQATLFGSGVIISEGRDLPDIRSVRVEMTATVTIGLADSQSVNITVDDNLMDYIETIVDDGVLIIRAADNQDLSHYDLDIELELTEVESIHCPGVATIRSSSTIETDVLRVTVEGVGTVVLELNVYQLETRIIGLGTIDYSGVAAQNLVSITGTATVSAYRLASANAVVGIAGSGTVMVTVIDNLDVSIAGVGTVYYKGNPTITQSIQGTGALVDAN